MVIEAYSRTEWCQVRVEAVRSRIIDQRSVDRVGSIIDVDDSNQADYNLHSSTVCQHPRQQPVADLVGTADARDSSP